MNPLIKELTNLLICPLQCLERTQTAFVDQPRATDSESFDLRFLFIVVVMVFSFKQPYIIIPIVKNYVDSVVFQCFCFPLWP